MLQPASHSFPRLFCEHTWQKFDMGIPPTPKKMPDFQVFSPSNWGWDWPNLWKPMMRRGMASMTCSSWDRVLRLQGFYNPKVWLVLRDGFNEMVNTGICLSAIFHPFWKIKVILTLKTETIKEAVQSPWNANVPCTKQKYCRVFVCFFFPPCRENLDSTRQIFRTPGIGPANSWWGVDGGDLLCDEWKLKVGRHILSPTGPKLQVFWFVWRNMLI